jgi:hypothetical protein
MKDQNLLLVPVKECRNSKLDCFSTASCDPALVSDFLSPRFGLQVQHSDRSFAFAMRQDSLKIFSCHVEMQFSSLKNLKRLRLHDCSAVTEVHSLRDLESLEINCCKAITDVSVLGNVHKLRISHCSGIKDISGLTNNYSLSVEACANLKIFPKRVNCVIFESTFGAAGIEFPHVRRIHFMVSQPR